MLEYNNKNDKWSKAVMSIRHINKPRSQHCSKMAAGKRRDFPPCGDHVTAIRHVIATATGRPSLILPNNSDYYGDGPRTVDDGNDVGDSDEDCLYGGNDKRPKGFSGSLAERLSLSSLSWSWWWFTRRREKKESEPWPRWFCVCV